MRSAKYLEVLIRDQWDPLKEIKCRIEIERDAFLNTAKCYQSRHQCSNKNPLHIMLYLVCPIRQKFGQLKTLMKENWRLSMWIYR